MIRVELPEGKEMQVLMEFAEEGYSPASHDGRIACFHILTELQKTQLRNMNCHILPEKTNSKRLE